MSNGLKLLYKRDGQLDELYQELDELKDTIIEQQDSIHSKAIHTEISKVETEM